MIRRLTAPALLSLLFAAVPAARAGIVYSNFGAGFSYNTSEGNFIGNGLDGSGSNYAEADTFTASAAYTVTSLEIALSNYYGTNTDELQVSLAADSGSGTPGAVLASFDVLPGTLGMLGGYNAPVTFTAPAGLTLAAGGQYWVTVADIGGGTDSNVWNWNSTGDTSAQAISTDGGTTWFSPSGLPAGAYQVDGIVASSVPEPGSLQLLLAGGGLGLLGDRWRRRRLRARRPAVKRPQAEPLEDRVMLSTTFTWAQANSLYAGTGTALQYPDGSVMMQGDYYDNNGSLEYTGGTSNVWDVLKPSSTGSYVNNSNPSFSLMGTSRLYFGSDVLPDGKIFVMGGEYSGTNGDDNEINTGEMYSGGAWSPIANYPQATFGDNSTMLLNDGLILLGTGAAQGQPYTANGFTYLYNPTSTAITAMVNGSSHSIAPGTYSAGIPTVYNETNSEEAWVKLPDGDVLSYMLWESVYFHSPSSGGYAELFNPTTGSWQDISPADGTANGSIPALSSVYDLKGNYWFEEGPALLLPNGNVFIVSGGTSDTALYNQATNTWSPGPQIPYPYTADDAPGAVLPDGDVIFAADAALANGEYTGPTALFDYTPPANGVGPGTITKLTGLNSPNDPGLAYGSYPDRMLVLPTGQLMFVDGNYDEIFVGTPSGAPLPQWRPVVNGITGGSGGVYTLTGLRLNGMDAGSAYGDDAQSDENYPIVRFANSAGTVYYATTSNWSLLGVATGNTPESVTFALPAGMPAGNYSLIVSGAGVNSFPVAFHVNSPVVSDAAAASLPAGRTPVSGGFYLPHDRPTVVATGLAPGSQSLLPFGNDVSDSNLAPCPPPSSTRPPALPTRSMRSSPARSWDGSASRLSGSIVGSRRRRRSDPHRRDRETGSRRFAPNGKWRRVRPRWPLDLAMGPSEGPRHPRERESFGRAGRRWSRETRTEPTTTRDRGIIPDRSLRSEFAKESDSRFQIEYSMNGSNDPHWFSIHLSS